MYRPSKYFEIYETCQLHLVEGIKLHSLHTFPSGHSSTSFNLFLMMALMIKNNVLKLFFFVVAALVAYSRVYISQHFLADIVAGSILGVVFIVVAWIWLEKKDKNWLDKSILSYIKPTK
jgi:membrane-associated phospholipid phosphatase